MPYSLPVHAAGHRRFHSGDGALPSSPATTLPRRHNASPVFHFNNDQDSSSDSDSPHTIPALKLKSRPISFHGAPTAGVPLPVQRTNSSPILLSNGKPLKSSLKSSPSAPSMPSSPTEEHPSGPAGRTRASSTPNTPALEHHVPKNVHFPSNKLATVRFYSRSARPASLSLADGGDTETETESERLPYPSFASSQFPKTKMKGKKMVHTLDTALSSLVPAPSPPAHANVHLESLVLHHTSNHAPISSTPSSFLPFPSSSSSPLSSTSPATSLSLKGTLLVRNIAYEKTVAVRFTLDEWDTTSEVLAHYTASLPALPPALYVPGSGLQGVHLGGASAGAVEKPAWDRFAFTIRLDDYAPSLATRTLWLVVRYCTPTAGSGFGSGSGSGEGTGIGTEESEQGGSGIASNNEWWDNNGGGNYRVVFRLREEGESESIVKPLPMPVPPPPPPIALRAVPSTLPTTSTSSTTISPPSSSPTAQCSRLRALSLSNYAAPVPVSPTSPTSSFSASLPHSPHSLGSHLNEHEHEHEQTQPSPSLSSISTPTPDSSPSLPTPVDIGMGMEMVNGFPATGPTGLGFGVGLGLDTGFEIAGGMVPGPIEKHEETTHHAHGGKTKSGAISLYWPWGRHHPPSHSPDHSSPPEHEHEHAVRVAPPSPSVAMHTTLKHLPIRRRHGSPPPPLREPSPTLSDYSSSSSSSGSSSGLSGNKAGGGRRPRVGRRVFGPLASSGGVGPGPGIPSGFVGRTAMPVHPPIRMNTTSSSSSSPTPTHANEEAESDKEKMEREKERMESDKVYQALVRKWCFAGPQHPQKELHQPQLPQDAQHPQEGGGGMHLQGRGRGSVQGRPSGMQGRGGIHPHPHHHQGRGDEGMVH